MVLLLSAFLSGCAERAPETLFDGEYKAWSQTISEPLTYPVPGHGERRRMIYINEIGTDVTVSVDDSGVSTYEYPEGSIILKENYSDVEGSELMQLTIMIKAPEDEMAQEGWIWLTKDPETGEERIFDESNFCIVCHDDANQTHPYGDRNVNDEFRDYVFFPYLPDAE